MKVMITEWICGNTSNLPNICLVFHEFIFIATKIEIVCILQDTWGWCDDEAVLFAMEQKH